MHWLARAEHHLPRDCSWLSHAEAERANEMRFTKRRSEFLIARWTAKQALIRVLGLGESTAHRLEIGHAASGAPVPYLDRQRVDVQISLTDRAGWAVCLVSTGTSRIGCDLELVEQRSTAFVRDYLTETERRYVESAASADARDVAANLVWSAKESALKVLTTGLRRDTRSVEVSVGPSEDVWGPLVVRTSEGQSMPGWWRRFGSFLLTTAAERATAPPIGLDETPLLDAAEPTHTWLGQPLCLNP